MKQILETLRDLELILAHNVARLLGRHIISIVFICMVYTQLIKNGIIAQSKEIIISSLFGVFIIIGMVIHKSFMKGLEKAAVNKYDKIKEYSKEKARIIVYIRDIQIDAERNAKKCFNHMVLAVFLVGTNIMIVLTNVLVVNNDDIVTNIIVILLCSIILSAIISIKIINDYIKYHIYIYELKGFEVC